MKFERERERERERKRERETERERDRERQRERRGRGKGNTQTDRDIQIDRQKRSYLKRGRESQEINRTNGQQLTEGEEPCLTVVRSGRLYSVFDGQ